jgi:hypothetical protein
LHAPQVRGESAAQDLLAVLGVLEAAPELRDLLRGVERDLNKFGGEERGMDGEGLHGGSGGWQDGHLVM